MLNILYLICLLIVDKYSVLWYDECGNYCYLLYNEFENKEYKIEKGGVRECDHCHWLIDMENGEWWQCEDMYYTCLHCESTILDEMWEEKF